MRCHTLNFRAMGSPCELRLYAKDAAQAQRGFDAARAVIERLEARYSRYRDDSLTSRINAAAGGAAIEVDAETAGLLDYAARAHAQSDGLFDLTSGVLRRAWDFRSGRLPMQAELDALLPLVGWEHVEWQRPWLRLPRAGMELDFGGLVKEYAADAAAQACRNAGLAHGLVELGGDISLVGPHPDGAPWRIGVRDPHAPQQALAMIDLHEGAIASSGDYERGMTVNGVRYGHLLHPRSGWPVRALAAVSVAAPQCLVAGTASTVAMLKQSDGASWLEQLELPHLGVTADGRIFGELARPELAAPSGGARAAISRLRM